MIDYDALYAGIYDIVQPLIDPIPLMIEFQNETPSARVYAVYRIIRSEQVGQPQWGEPDVNGVSTITHVYNLTIRFQMIGQGSQGALSDLHAKLTRPSVIDAFSDLDLDFYDRGMIRDVPRLKPVGYEARGMFEMQYYIKVVDTDDTGYFNSVTVETTIKDQADVVKLVRTDTYAV